jgi:uncharacterized repeat protein (TIGR01451 family)
VVLDSFETISQLVTISTSVGVPILELHKEGTPDLVEAGESLVYTINFSNTGNLIANAVAVTDVLDVHVHFAGSVPEPGRGSGDVWVWEFDELGIGRSDSIVITATVDSPLTNSLSLTNVVYIRSEIPRTEIVSNTEVVTVSSAPVLGLAKIDLPDPVDPGALLTYTIVYSNSGNANATGASVRENYDFLTCFVTATLRPDNYQLGCCDADSNSEWNLGVLPADGKNHFITVTVRVSDSALAGSVIRNEVILSSFEAEDAVFAQTCVIECRVWLPLVVRNWPQWNDQNDQNLTGKSIFALAGCEDGTLLSGSDDGIYHRAPGDIEWELEQSTSGTVVGLAVSPDCKLLYAAVFNQGVLKRDSGSWSPVSDPGMEGVRTVVLSGSVILAGGGFGVRYSEVGEDHEWQRPNRYFGDRTVISLATSGGRIYAAVWGDGVWCCNKSDLNQWWSQNYNLGQLDSLHTRYAIGSPSDGEPRFAGTKDGLYCWNSQNKEWRKAFPSQANATTYWIVLDDARTFAGQRDNGVLQNTGDCQWKGMNNGWGPPSRVRSLLIHVDECGWRWLYAGTDEGVWRYPLP